jgi:hypothetical protein
MRVLRPLFHNNLCKCGKFIDPCGHHSLRCAHTPYSTIHHGVRDGCMRWMQAYIKRQHNSSFKAVSERDSQSQCEVSNYYMATTSLVANAPVAGRRSDGVLWALNDPMRPWIIDFVQTQTTTDKLDARLRELDRKYDDKIKIYSDSHPTIPLSRIVPFVFTSDGILHPKTEEFMDWFLCKAASTELMEAPSHEKISFRHAFLSSLQDKTAFLITAQFEATLREAHSNLFPLTHLETFNSHQYSEPPQAHSLLFDSQASSSSSSSQHELTSESHPLAPRNASLLNSTRVITSLPSPQPTTTSTNASRRQSTPPLSGTSRPHLSPTPDQPTNPYARVYSTTAGTRRGHPDTRTPSGDDALLHHRVGPGSVALPAHSPVGVLFRAHLSRDGWRA